MPTTLALNVTIPDADLADLVAALRLRHATNGNPNPTIAQMRTAEEADLRQRYVSIVVQYRRDQTAITVPVLT